VETPKTMKKALFTGIFAALLCVASSATSFAAVGDAWLDNSPAVGAGEMEEIREDLLHFTKKEYRHIGRNPFYKGGIPEALRKGELGRYEEMLQASLDAYGINTAELHAEFVRIAEGKARRATLKNGDPFFAVNQRGGVFVKASKLPNGSRGLLRNETGKDISGVLLVLMEGATDDNGGKHPVIILIADECGNAFLLPPHPNRPVVSEREQADYSRAPQQVRERRGPSFGEVVGTLVVGAVAHAVLDRRHDDQCLSPHRGYIPPQHQKRNIPRVVDRVCRNGRWFDVLRYPDGRARLVPVAVRESSSSYRPSRHGYIPAPNRGRRR